MKQYHEENKDHLRELHRLRRVERKYNLPREKYLQMIVDQQNLCAICHQPETWLTYRDKTVRPLCVDHCHKTGNVRELLCVKCNALLGHAQDNPEILKSAIEYLLKHKEE